LLLLFAIVGVGDAIAFCVVGMDEVKPVSLDRFAFVV
jgi:hypothetical protein